MAQLRGEALAQERMINRRKDEFVSIVSHELNTPLVAILGWTRWLRSNPSSLSMLAKALDTIERNATLQAKLVQDLLDISRITAGKLRLNLQPIDLIPVIEAAIATVAQTAQDKGIDLQFVIFDFELSATNPNLTASQTPETTHPKSKVDRLNAHDEVQNPKFQVLGDGDRLQQVICNLLTNAIKFTPESGSITVELSQGNDALALDNRQPLSHSRPSTPEWAIHESPRLPTPEWAIHESPLLPTPEWAIHKSPLLPTPDSPPSAQIRIIDTGIGIAPDVLPQIFDRFYQAKTSADKGLGLGLGLAIAHHLVELHHGTIEAESAGKGQGAIFTLQLPLHQV
ncbi:sensor histidine kinase [Egbenema bharatensis]|uniref:sensor histidine kinase n=1 Tax=Egbenema bharatensis TaxID=3463334 RepID=UPI003A8BB8C6